MVVKILAENAQWILINQKLFFKWFQLINALSKSWKLAVLNDKVNCKNNKSFNHHLINNNQILAIEKLIPKELFIYCSWKRVSYVPKLYFKHFPHLTGWMEKYYLLHVKFQLTPAFVCSKIKYWTIFYILINSFYFLIKKMLNCVLTVVYKMRHVIAFL